MGKLKILLLEDNLLDAELILAEITIHKLDFTTKHVENRADFTSSLQSFQPDIILSDYNLPQFTGFDALEIVLKMAPEIPFILVTGHLSEEVAAEAIKRGAWDYILKDNLIRLVPAIENALKLKEEKNKNEIAEKELIKLSSAVKQSANTIIITDTEGNIEYTNPKFTELTGYTAKEVFGKNPRFLSSGNHSKKNYTELWKTIKAGKNWTGTFQNKKKNGELFWEQATITPIKNNIGNIINFLAVKEDISNLKKSEKALEEAQKIAKIGSYNLDLKANTATTSNSFNDIAGIDSEKKLSFAIWRTITHPEDSSANQKMLDKCIKLNKLFDREYRILTKDTQELKWVHGLGKVIYENGKAKNFIGTIQDVTERKKAEIELQKVYSEVEQLKKQLEQENILLKEEITLSFNYEDLVYSSEEISDILTLVEQVSSTSATVLILGETGTGKELIAKAIHNTSNRKNHPLIRVNCAAIPSELLESELLGIKKDPLLGLLKIVSVNFN